jgi:hypothetical protein
MTPTCVRRQQRRDARPIDGQLRRAGVFVKAEWHLELADLRLRELIARSSIDVAPRIVRHAKLALTWCRRC